MGLKQILYKIRKVVAFCGTFAKLTNQTKHLSNINLYPRQPPCRSPALLLQLKQLQNHCRIILLFQRALARFPSHPSPFLNTLLSEDSIKLYNSMQGTEGQYLTITTHKPALRSSNVFQMLVFEWIQFIYYLYMFSSVLYTEHFQPRMLIYCLLFLLFDKLELTYKYLQLEDPLHLSTTINCVRYLSYLIILDLSGLLVRIVLDNLNLHAFIVIMHFVLVMVLFLNQFSKKNTKLDINVDYSNVTRFVTPMSLFVFNKTSHPRHPDFWYLQGAFFAINLFIASELDRILLLKECLYFGRLPSNESPREKSKWSRKRALRAIIVVCCILVVTQNLLLIFDRIKFEISVTILHSFIVAIVAYLLYIDYLPIRK